MDVTVACLLLAAVAVTLPGQVLAQCTAQNYYIDLTVITFGTHTSGGAPTCTVCSIA